MTEKKQTSANLNKKEMALFVIFAALIFLILQFYFNLGGAIGGAISAVAAILIIYLIRLIKKDKK